MKYNKKVFINFILVFQLRAKFDKCTHDVGDNPVRLNINVEKHIKV